MKFDDSKFKNFQEQIKKLGKIKIRLGAVGEHTSGEGSISNHDLMLIHEFGTSDGIPARMPIRKTIGDPATLKLMQKTLEHACEKNFSDKTGFDLPAIGDAVGNTFKQLAKGTIMRRLDPPLSEEYLRKKTKAGFTSVPLVKTKQLVNSLQDEVIL